MESWKGRLLWLVLIPLGLARYFARRIESQRLSLTERPSGT